MKCKFCKNNWSDNITTKEGNKWVTRCKPCFALKYGGLYVK